MTTLFRRLQNSLKKTRFTVLLFLLFFAICIFASVSFAKGTPNETCLGCHGEKSLEVQTKAGKRSLYVDGAKFKGSVHDSTGCVGCHPDADVADFPHPAKLKEVKCANCHAGEQETYDTSIHGLSAKRGAQYAPTCTSCHGKHDILKGSNHDSPTFKMNIPLLCGKCHKEDAPVAKLYDIPQKDIIEHYRESIHGEGLFKKGLLVTATCNDCHSAHGILPHTDARSTVSAGNIAKTCSKCHTMIEQVHKKVIRGSLWENKPGAVPACTDCHSPHEIRKESLVVGMADRNCLKCHEKEKPIVHPEAITKSAHAKIPCVKCHSDVSPEHARPCDTSAKIDCGGCHVKQAEAYTESIHGKLKAKSDPDAPTCTDCHGTHDVSLKMDDKSPIFRRNIPALCAKCHRAGEKAAVRYKGELPDIVKSYQMSTHGKGVIESGLMSSAVCIDCHTSHRELPASDPNSSVNNANLAETCAKCHRGIYEKFAKSIHSPLVSHSKEKLPACSDCHTAHGISRVEKNQFLQEVSHQCATCHKEVAESYFQTYHGKAYQLGYLKAAKCSDCHGVHDILKPSDPNSHLSRNNVVATCKKCHPNSSRQFAGYLTHATHHNRYKYPILFYTFWAMTSLLIGTFLFFGVHTILWLPKSFARLKEKRAEGVFEDKRQFMRFKLRERILHFTVIISFFGLAITGMVLKFADMAWASFVTNLIGGAAMARVIHRFCAVLTFGYFATHLYTIYCFKRDNKISYYELIFHRYSLVPSWRDAVEFFQTMKWFLGFGERPRYGRWTYWEKFDYFAVFWGVAIIGFTGLILWFPEMFTLILPGWVVNVATIIHSDEALLAVGFIFTIHFFNTHLRPDAFPVDPVIFTGRTSLKELEHDRPREYEELRETGELELNIVPPVSKRRLMLIYAFGLTCLVIGVALIVLIIYSMLAGYK